MIYKSATIQPHNGGFRAILQYKDETGKWRRKTKVMKSTAKRAAEKEMEEWRDQLEREHAAKQAGALDGCTVAEYVEAYIDGVRLAIQPSTARTYKYLLDLRIRPAFHDVKLDDLTPDMVQSWVNGLSQEFAKSTARKSLTLLRSAMRQAVDRDRLKKDPTRGVKAPKKESPKPNALDEAGRAALLTTLDALDLTNPVLLAAKMALFTGMREGELCGLRWRDVDLDANLLRVEHAIGFGDEGYFIKEPKNEGSARTIRYPAELADDLRTKRTDMQKFCLAAGIPFSEEFYVLGQIDGSYMKPRNLSAEWRALAGTLGLVGTQGRVPTFHDLRHTYATAAIASGIDVKTVSNSLGHSNAAMTLNIYASVDPDAQRRAADKMGAIFEATRKLGQPRIIPMTGTDGPAGNR